MAAIENEMTLPEDPGHRRLADHDHRISANAARVHRSRYQSEKSTVTARHFCSAEIEYT